MAEFDWGVRAGRLMTMKDHQATVVRDYFIGVKDENIVAIEPYRDQFKDSKQTLNASDRLVMPGLINTHTHLPMSLFRGLADDLPFEEWLHKYILPLERDLVSPDFVKTGTELSALELIRFGVTTFCDSYFYTVDMAECLDRSGLRGFVSECVSDFPTPDDKERKGQNYLILDELRERFGSHERIYPAIAPHAPYSCSDQTLRQAHEYAKKHDLLQNIHVSETAGEVSESVKQYGKTPVVRLRDLGITDQRSIFAHCVHVSEEEIRIMVKHGIGAAHNPESNMKLSAGVAPLPSMLKLGLAVGLGTDSVASNNNLTLFQEMDTAAKLQKLNSQDNASVSAVTVLDMATLKGAEALGLSSKIGSLEVGKHADLIAVDLREPHMRPLYDIPSQLAYSATGLEVSTVMCHGKLLYDNSEFKTLDYEQVAEDVTKWQEKIQKKVQSL